MTQLLLMKETVKTLIGKYEVYLKPLGKFLLALFTLIIINSNLGYMSRLSSVAIVMVVALMCSFMPINFIVACAGLFVLLHFYELSIESAIVALIVFMVLSLLYFRFSPKDTLVVLLLPICFALKIPYVIPISIGLLGLPTSAVAVACGTVVYYMIHFVKENSQVIMAMDAEDMSSRFRYVVDGILKNKTMLVVMVVFAITVILVYLIRRLSIDHAWTIAILVGTIAQILMLLVGNLMMDTDISIIGILFGGLFSAGIAKLVEFIAFNLDYTRTEKVQFEDDEYYYYVKAVPKLTVSRPTKTVKKINAQKKRKKTH